MIITRITGHIPSLPSNKHYDLPKAADIRCTVLVTADENTWLQSFRPEKGEKATFSGIYDGTYWILKGAWIREGVSSVWTDMLEVELSVDRITLMPTVPALDEEPGCPTCHRTLSGVRKKRLQDAVETPDG